MSPDPAAPARVTMREASIATILLASWWLGFAIWDRGVVITRRFWLDELCCTVYALRDSSNPLELARNALAYDIAPPLLHLITWPVTTVFGTSPVAVRSVPLASVALATILLYFLLRRRFTIAPSAAGVLAVLSNSLVIRHAFDARFYGPWLLLGVAFAWSLGLDAGRPSRRRDIMIAVIAVCLCTLHWFGVTSLALLATGAALARWPRWREGLRLVAPSIAGPVALALLLPAMFRQLSHGGDALLWVPKLNLSQVMQMAQLFWIRLPIAVAVALLLADRFAPRMMGHERPAAPIGSALRDPGIAALLAALFMPVVLIAITLVFEPVMVPRYAIVAALATAPLVALAFETLHRVGRIAVALVLALFLIGFADREIQHVRYSESVLDAYDRAMREVHAINAGLPLVFQSYFVLYAVDGNARRQSAGRVLELSDAALDSLFPDAAMLAEKSRLKTDRAMVRLHEEGFGFPRVVTMDQLRATPRFVLLARDEDLPYGHREAIDLGRKIFPSHVGRRMSDVVTLFELRVRADSSLRSE